MYRRKVGHRTKLPEPVKRMKVPGELAACTNSCDPVEIRRQNFQTPGSFLSLPVGNNRLNYWELRGQIALLVILDPQLLSEMWRS